ncbi:Ferredoxin, root R-B2 [Apostasia shenzhenica]|uniref:Ferredoxin n=1 Tax=Apostasia shenzhenica TaxID=1088818 RepID=A0A2I0AW19_9ASPA|nr:Ferredoxin, root R-B2 [Apostasia shenzhenica]
MSTTSLSRLSVSSLLPPITPKPFRPAPTALDYRRRRFPGACRAYKVTIEHGDERRTIEVGEEETILGRALAEGVDVPHDCKLGVCMTCPARLLAGTVDQSEGMLSDDVIASGYALLCASYPRSDCVIRTIPEEELLSLQLATAND